MARRGGLCLGEAACARERRPVHRLALSKFHISLLGLFNLRAELTGRHALFQLAMPSRHLQCMSHPSMGHCGCGFKKVNVVFRQWAWSIPAPVVSPVPALTCVPTTTWSLESIHSSHTRRLHGIGPGGEVIKEQVCKAVLGSIKRSFHVSGLQIWLCSV